MWMFCIKNYFCDSKGSIWSALPLHLDFNVRLQCRSLVSQEATACEWWFICLQLRESAPLFHLPSPTHLHCVLLYLWSPSEQKDTRVLTLVIQRVSLVVDHMLEQVTHKLRVLVVLKYVQMFQIARVDDSQSLLMDLWKAECKNKRVMHFCLVPLNLQGNVLDIQATISLCWVICNTYLCFLWYFRIKHQYMQ